jgi:hypothetical protein
MQSFIELARDAAGLGAVSSLLYVCTITVTTLAATLSRDPQRRLDARQALRILLRQRGEGGRG